MIGYHDSINQKRSVDAERLLLAYFCSESAGGKNCESVVHSQKDYRESVHNFVRSNADQLRRPENRKCKYAQRRRLALQEPPENVNGLSFL